MALIVYYMCILPQYIKAFTQFESSSQSSDDSDGVGGVCAELVQWGEESVPLVLQLDTGNRKLN